MRIEIGSLDEKKPDEYEIKNWAEKILEAEEIKNDPEKMKLVAPYLEKKAKAINSVADLRKLREKGYAADSADTSDGADEEE